VPRARPLRGPDEGDRAPPRARPDRARGAAVPAFGRALLPLPQRDRAVAVGQAVVRRGGPAEGPGDRGGRGRADRVPSGTLEDGLPRVAPRAARLEHLPAAVVGPPHPGLVLPERARIRGG